MPTPGPETVSFGGNTSCVELLLDDGTVLVFDAGTGIIDLGPELIARGVDRLHLFLTHLHLDHLEGLRFFAPLWNERVELDIWGPPSPSRSLRERISQAFSPPLFPIDLQDVPARVTFRDVPRGRWRVGNVSLAADLVVHPGPTVGFRVKVGSSTFAYIPDHEPALAGIDDRSTDWMSGAAIAAGADLLIHDAQYLEEEYATRVGWGHSSVRDAVAFARKVGAQRLLLFHHEPEHSDAALERLEEHARSLVRDGDPKPELAREGMVVELP